MRSSTDAERISTVGFSFVGPIERESVELVAGDWVLRRCSVVVVTCPRCFRLQKRTCLKISHKKNKNGGGCNYV